jgi:hypothetical protein
MHSLPDAFDDGGDGAARRSQQRAHPLSRMRAVLGSQATPIDLTQDEESNVSLAPKMSPGSTQRQKLGSGSAKAVEISSIREPTNSLPKFELPSRSQMEPQRTHFHSSATSSRVSSHGLNAQSTQPRVEIYAKPTKLPSESLDVISYSESTAEDRSKAVGKHITVTEAHNSPKAVVSTSRPSQEVMPKMKKQQDFCKDIPERPGPQNVHGGGFDSSTNIQLSQNQKSSQTQKSTIIPDQHRMGKPIMSLPATEELVRRYASKLAGQHSSHIKVRI